MSNDDSTEYRVTRRATGRSTTLRDVVDVDVDEEPFVETDERKTHRDLPRIMPDGSQTNVRRVARKSVPPVTDLDAPIPVLPSLATINHRSATIMRGTFGGVDIVVEHRGSEVTIILPGSVRLIGTREEAMQLISMLVGQG